MLYSFLENFKWITSTIYIANEQKNITKRKLNLDLYEKRYKIYYETKEFIHTCIIKNKITTEEHEDFIVKTNEKYFLFGSEIIEYLNLLVKNSDILEDTAHDFEEKEGGTEEREKLVNERGDMNKWFRDQWFTLESKFLKYLDFKNLK